MRLTVIGCSGSAPGPDSPASCYLLEHDGYRVLLDLGNGALGALQRHLPPEQLDAIVLSHLHADHCLDMTTLSVYLRYGGVDLTAPIPVYGPGGTAQRLATAYLPDETPELFAGLFEFREHADATLGPFEMRVALANHPVPAVAVRLDAGGSSLVYSGDTGATPALVELAREADVLLCEASWGGDDPPVPDIHLSGREAGEHAQAAGVGRLLLTHIPPWIAIEPTRAAAARAFDGPVDVVSGGERYDLSAPPGPTHRRRGEGRAGRK